MNCPERENPFEETHYQNINTARMEHLLSLDLPIEGRSVLELGAGIGDLSRIFIDQARRVLIVEGRSENIEVLHERYDTSDFLHVDIMQMDLEDTEKKAIDIHDIVFCYGLLYHVADPIQLIKWIASHCSQYLILETCVSTTGEVNNVLENKANVTQSVSGVGCRPGRAWLFEELKKHFQHVYMPYTQPDHEQFPNDWENTTDVPGVLIRSIYVASKRALDNNHLCEGILTRQPIT
jgi:SAM-dependent methyltransferase